jgi:hypothetical protein
MNKNFLLFASIAGIYETHPNNQIKLDDPYATPYNLINEHTSSVAEKSKVYNGARIFLIFSILITIILAIGNFVNQFYETSFTSIYNPDCIYDFSNGELGDCCKVYKNLQPGQQTSCPTYYLGVPDYITVVNTLPIPNQQYIGGFIIQCIMGILGIFSAFWHGSFSEILPTIVKLLLLAGADLTLGILILIGEKQETLNSYLCSLSGNTVPNQIGVTLGCFLILDALSMMVCTLIHTYAEKQMKKRNRL